ncbi:MAG: helix-turn-helix transcriptional regulator [Sphingomonadales bacterium]|nr:helix-turn-helix transcriptional regulator [Sphingomonadales bacterium]
MGSFGTILKEWRTIRRYSQLGLALEADISARHLSFLESGRANPSKSMILRLSQALAMPRPIANQAMQAAGFAPAFPDIAAESNDLAPIRKAVERMLAAHDPFPGIAVDRHWNIVSANRGGEMLMAFTPPDTKRI